MQSETRKILESVQNGSISVDEALVRLKTQPFDDLGYAKVDFHREIRQGVPEVIYGAGKTPEQIVGIMGAMLKTDRTRITSKEKRRVRLCVAPCDDFSRRAGRKPPKR